MPSFTRTVRKAIIPQRSAVLVTGASTGIGKACALRLARDGFYVFAGIRKKTDGDPLKKEASSHRIEPIQIDVAREDMIIAAHQMVTERLGQRSFTGLVNNAGIVVPGPLECLTMDDLRRQFEVNVIGQMAVTKAFLPQLRQNQGRVVVIGSSSGWLSVPGIGAYCASKFAVRGLFNALRMELSPWHVFVSQVDPGCIESAIWDKSLDEARDRRKRLSAEVERLYGPSMDGAEKAAIKFYATAVPADHVANKVAHALTVKRPRSRYMLPMGAQIERLISFLPAFIQDRVVKRSAGFK